MIKTKSIYDKVEAADGKRIFVSTYRPKHVPVVADLWFPELGSELELMKNWNGRRFDWNFFTTAYLKKLQSPEIEKILKEVAAVALHETVTLIGHAKQSNQCHRTLLKEYLDHNYIYKQKNT